MLTVGAALFAFGVAGIFSRRNALTEMSVVWPAYVAQAAVLIATIATSYVTSIGRSTWFVGVQLMMVYAVLAMTLYLLPPAP